jgi:glycine/D-amino acid oxidase-like deaminating enzyme
MTGVPASVVVVGGGIVGLSTAYALVKAGVGVTLVEQGPIPNPLAASADHHRLIRSAYGDRLGYAARMPDAFAAWRAMWADLGRPEAHYYVPTGVLSVSLEQGDGADRSLRALEALGLPHERLEGGAIARRLPFLEPEGVRFALVTPGGALMANRILVDLADWLRRSGASVLEQSPVTAIDAGAGRVKLADGRSLTAETLVVAAGIATPRLLPELGLELVAQRTVIVYADPPADLIDAYAGAPSWSQLGGGHDLWGLAAVEGLPMKLGRGDLRREDPDGTDRRMTADEVAAVLDGYRGRFRGVDCFHVRWHQANHWTLAPEERFVLARHGRVVVVSACSGHGFKFGALSGRDVAEALTGPAPFEAVAGRMAGRMASRAPMRA